jgi:hypothetical protein
MKLCWKCNTEWSGFGQPSVKATCERCNEDLHVCRNCVNFDEHAASQCRERGIEPVLNKERANFCEEFQFRSLDTKPQAAKPAITPAEAARAKWDKLFKKP